MEWCWGRVHTPKKFTNVESSGASVVAEAVDDGSSMPSMTAIVGTASSSSNSLYFNKMNERKN